MPLITVAQADAKETHPMPRKTERAHMGQTIITESGADRSAAPPKVDATEAILGKTKKGGPRDISHSVSGASTTDYGDRK